MATECINSFKKVPLERVMSLEYAHVTIVYLMTVENDC